MAVLIRLVTVVIRVDGERTPMGDERNVPPPAAMVHRHVCGRQEKGNDHRKV
jgi:hypothetical protein